MKSALTAFLCRLHLHAWSRWEQYDWQGKQYVSPAWAPMVIQSTEALETIYRLHKKYLSVDATERRQQRHCQRCGKEQRERVVTAR